MKKNQYLLLLVFLISTISLYSQYDIVVAKDGSGNYSTVQAAVNAAPSNSSSRTVIYIKNGTYKEVITVASNKTNLTFIGQSSTGTILTYNNGASTINPATGQPYGTWGSASFNLQASGFYATNITFENSYGAGTQAMAMNMSGDKAVFNNCRFLGRQDTWYGYRCRAYLKNCYIEGSTDFIFGQATAFFDGCTIYSYGGSALTAANTESYVTYGLVFKNCTVSGASGVSTLLGRTWGAYAATAFINCSLSSIISPAGWNDWGNAANQSTSRYNEYGNTGTGANTSGRVSWCHFLNSSQAASYTYLNVLKTTYSSSPTTDNWDPMAVINGTSSGSSGASAFSTIEAESFMSQSGIQTESCIEGGLDVGYINNGDWVRYNSVNFGTGASGFSARVASNASGGTISIRIDAATGTQAGTCSVSNTGGWQSWTTVNSSVSGVSGVHDLYLVFTGGSGYLFNLNNFVFSSSGSSSSIANGSYSIIAKHSGKGLDVYNFSMDNGGNIVQWPYWGGNNQQFNITQVDGEYYSIINVNSNKGLDVASYSTSNGANIQQWNYAGGSNQQFKFASTGDGYYQIVNRNSGKCLDVEAVSTADGANIQQYSCGSGSNQRWQLNLISLKSAETSLIENTEIPISGSEIKSGIIIYPSPAIDGVFRVNFINADLNEEFDLEVFNIQGQLVFKKRIVSHAEVETGLASGFYLISVISANNRYAGKLEIQ